MYYYARGKEEKKKSMYGIQEDMPAAVREKDASKRIYRGHKIHCGDPLWDKPKEKN